MLYALFPCHCVDGANKSESSIESCLCAALRTDKHSQMGVVSELSGRSHLLIKLFTFTEDFFGATLFAMPQIKMHHNEPESDVECEQ